MLSLSHSGQEELPVLSDQACLPDAYRLPEDVIRGPVAALAPRVVFIEVTNRCNLHCETCPRTFFTREPPRSLSFDEFVTIADQFPAMRRAALHGIGEPLLNRELPGMIQYLKQCDVEVIINSNGTLLDPTWQAALVRSGLDEFRCSIDAATPEAFAQIRGADLVHKIEAGLAGLVEAKARLASDKPRVSIWCVATQQNLQELPGLIRLAADLGVPEVYVQRLVYFAQDMDQQFGMAKDELAIFGRERETQDQVLAECESLAAELGIALWASGARDPRASLASAQFADATPWQACMRPWTTAYVTANGNCLPCCISPFATSDYESLVMGNLFEHPFDEIWNVRRYQAFRAKLLSVQPHPACASCGVYWSL